MALAWKKSPEDLSNLYWLELGVLRQLYPECKYLAETKNRYKHLIDSGELPMPEKPQFNGDIPAEQERIARRRGVARKTGKMVTLQVLEEHKHYYDKMQEALEGDGHPHRAIFYEMGYTTGEGADKVADTQPLASIEVRFDEEKDALYEAISKITPIKALSIPRSRRKESIKGPGESRQDMACGDPHFGYYRMPDGELIPIHDEYAIDIFHQTARDIQPEKIIIGGDLIDFAGLSRWEQLGSFIDTLNPTLERTAKFLDTLRTDCPNTKIILVEGNHDQRPTKARNISPQVAELLKLTRPGEKDPVLSVQYLLDLDRRGVEFLRGNAARAQVNDRLGVMHKGNPKKSIGRDWRSTIGFDGHSINMPRPEVITMPDGEIVTVMNYMLPMLGRVDGTVPSNTSSYDHYGYPDLQVQNWVQGFGVIEYLPGNAPFQVHTVFTNPHDGYQAFYNGRAYQPRREDESFA